MNFYEIAQERYSCRKYDTARPISEDQIEAVLSSAILAPSACNTQPYLITVCRGETVRALANARSTSDERLNTFIGDADTVLVISEQPVVVSPAMEEHMAGQNFRDIDIGILAAYITAEATAQGLGSCIVGLFDDAEVRRICALDTPVRLLITLGYPRADVKRREKVRKAPQTLIRRA